MPADLDALFLAARAYADGVPLPLTDAVRERGRRRQRAQRTAVVVAVVLVAALAAGTGAVLSGHRGGPPRPAVTPGPTHTVRFRPLVPVPAASVVHLPGEGAVLAQIVGDRAFLGWREDSGMLKVGAIDLRTGQAAWPVRQLGKYGDWNGMIAIGSGLLAIGEHDDGHDPDYTMFIVDPATGAVRWQREFSINDDDLVPYDSVLVYTKASEGITYGLDWHTGQARWQFRNPGGGTGTQRRALPMYTPADLAGPSRPLFGGFAAAAADNRLVEVTADRAVRVYDVGSGTLLSTVRDAVPGQSHLLPYDGRLYLADDGPGYQVRLFDLPGRTRDRPLYRGPAGRQLEALMPCGTGRICVLDDNHAGADWEKTAEVAAVDAGTGREIWRRPAANTDTLIPVGDRILVTAGRYGGRGGRTSLLFDPDGRQLLRDADRHALAGRVTDGSLLLLEPPAAASNPPDPAHVPLDVVGVSALDGTRTPLGSLTAASAGCSWDERFLVCPTDSDFQVWRFASG
jgi:molecular chaperone HscA